MVAACHLTENLFDALRTGAAPVTPLAIEAALQACGFVADQLNELNNGDRAGAAWRRCRHDAGAHPDGRDRRQGEAAPAARQLPGCRSCPSCLAAPPTPGRTGAAAPPAGRRRSRLGQPCTTPWCRPAPPSPAAERRSPPQPLRRPLPRRPQAAAPAKPGRLGWRRTPRRSKVADARAAAAPAKDESIRIDAVKLDALLEVAGESVQAANQAAVLLEKPARSSSSKARPPTLMATLTETLEPRLALFGRTAARDAGDPHAAGRPPVPEIPAPGARAGAKTSARKSNW